MAADRKSGFFTLNPRRRPGNWLLRPGIQLALPFTLVTLTAGFGLLFAAHVHGTYQQLFSLALQDTTNPAFFTRAVEAQTADFLRVSSVIGVAWALVVLAVSVVYAHRLVGPMVPIRRHVEALKNGDTASRVHLRQGDAFMEVARDLNELAEILADTTPKDEAPPPS